MRVRGCVGVVCLRVCARAHLCPCARAGVSARAGELAGGCGRTGGVLAYGRWVGGCLDGWVGGCACL